MTDADERDGVIVDRMAAADAFDVVADETRVAILKALATADGPLPFSRLRERADVADSGRFNYHLDKLLGTFVTKDEDGYDLGLVGLRVVGAILSGGYTQSFDGNVFETDAPCPGCDAPMDAHFEGNNAVIGCGECGFDFYRAPLPPGALAGRDPARLPELLDRYQKRRGWSSALGFCSYCDGPVRSTLYRDGQATEDRADHANASHQKGGDRGSGTRESGDPDGEGHRLAADPDAPLAVRTTCERCGTEVSSIVEAMVLTTPSVRAFHAEHGIDLRTTPLWDLPWLTPGSASVASEAPLRIDVPVTLGDDELLVTLDEDLAVVGSDHE